VNPLDLAVRIGRLLDELDLPWVLGGSLASSMVGEPRSTMDVDVAVVLDVDDVDRLVEAVEADYYMSAEMAREAVLAKSPFNLIHHETGWKVDLFPLSDDPLDRRQLDGRQRVPIAEGQFVWVGAAPDQVLRKLRWFRAGGEASERQWRDVVAILRIQGERIDRDQLIDDAGPLGLADLAARAIHDAGRSAPT